MTDGTPVPPVPPALAATLDALAPQLAVLRHDWWLIGSAAMALLRVEGIAVGDVDLLVEPEDGAALLAALGTETAPGTPSNRFRSELFGRWAGAALPVEVMGGFHVRHDGRWVRLRPATRRPIEYGGGRFFTPSVAEMIDICELFGRDKDLDRAARLRRLPSKGRCGSATTVGFKAEEV